MTFPDVIFVALVVGLPLAVSLRLFRHEPPSRPFIATYALAVLGSSILFTLAALAMVIAGVGGLGPFDGMFGFIVSVPIALVVGLIVRRRTRVAL